MKDVLKLVETYRVTPRVADRLEFEYARKLLVAANFDSHDFLSKQFIFGRAKGEFALEQGLSYDRVRMKIGRCLDEAQSLIA